MNTIVFDLDGTLVHSAPGLHYAVNLMLAEFGLAPLTLPVVTKFIGNGVPMLVRRSLEAGSEGAPVPDIDEAILRFNAIYLEDPMRDCDLYQGVDALLAALSQAGWKIALCTNKPVAAARQMLETCGIGAVFDSVIGGDSLPVRKPDPEPALRALSDAGGQKNRAVYLGDSIVDATTARNAELPFVYYSGGYNNGADIRCDLKIDAFTLDLLPKLNALLGRA